MGLFLAIELLLIFGTYFSKFNLYRFIHLYDVIYLALGIIGFVLFIQRNDRWVIGSMLLMLAISFGYFIYSWIDELGPTTYLIRHYALFGYLGLSYFIFAGFIDSVRQKFNIRFILLIALLATAFQAGFHIYLAIFVDGYSFLGRMNYISSTAILGIIVTGAFVIVYVDKPVLKYFLFSLVLILAHSLGHSSSFFAVFVIFFGYLVLFYGIPLKVIAVITLGLSLVGFINYFPEFSDYNSQWRLLNWSYTLRECLIDYYGLLGHGFGGPLVSQELVDQLVEQLDSHEYDRIDEIYLSPSHNSFLTIAFHIGFLPSLLLLVPLKKAFSYFVNRDKHQPDSAKDFLILSFIGVAVWASFNVILELPHSSAFFWLIYFTLIYHFESNSGSKNDPVPRPKSDS